MAVQIIYFVHGTTTDNEKGLSTGWNQGELSELGKKQAVELWDKIKDKKIDIVFSSDLKRAEDTAKLAFEGRVKIVTDSRLRECNYGELNGASSSIVEPMHEKMIIDKFPKGESYDDVKARMIDFIKFLKENYEGKLVGIVSHKAPQLALDVLLKNKTWEQAFIEDWRRTKSWQPGWNYIV